MPKIILSVKYVRGNVQFHGPFLCRLNTLNAAIMNWLNCILPCVMLSQCVSKTFPSTIHKILLFICALIQLQENVAYFSYPFEFEVFYKNESISETEVLPGLPQIFLEVLSIDSWMRYRTEGYGYMTLPSTPGRSLCVCMSVCVYVCLCVCLSVMPLIPG